MKGKRRASRADASNKRERSMLSKDTKSTGGGERNSKRREKTEEQEEPVFGPKTDIQELPRELVPIAVAAFQNKWIAASIAKGKKECRTLSEPFKLSNSQARTLALRYQAARNDNRRVDYSKIAGKLNFETFAGYATELAKHEPWLLQEIHLAYDEQLQLQQGETSPSRLEAAREQNEAELDARADEDREVKQAAQQLAAAKYLVPENASREESIMLTPEQSGVGIPGNVELVQRNAKLQQELDRFQSKVDSMHAKQQTTVRDLADERAISSGARHKLTTVEAKLGTMVKQDIAK